MYQLDEKGWVQGVTQLPTTHFDPGQEAPYLLVVHSASLPYGEFGNGILEKVFVGELSPQSDPWLSEYMSGRVSSHFLINRLGEIKQFVSLNDCAWHAGVSSFEGREGCNQFSIGIELEGCDYLPYNDAQYVSLNAMIKLICEAYPIRAVKGHSDIAPGRKTDPGPLFDWTRVITL